MVTPSGNMRALETLWMNIRWLGSGGGVDSPWGSSGSGRKELVDKPFLLGGIWGEIPSLSSWKTFREISWSENYGQFRCTLVVFAIPPSLSPFFLLFYFITTQCQNLWEKYLLCPRIAGLKQSPINCSCQNTGLNLKCLDLTFNL